MTDTSRKKLEDAARQYADDYWNISNDPKDWAYEDKKEDFLAGARWAEAQWAKERKLLVGALKEIIEDIDNGLRCIAKGGLKHAEFQFKQAQQSLRECITRVKQADKLRESKG